LDVSYGYVCSYGYVQHHCVTKMIGFDMIYGYIGSYGHSATTAIFDKRRINTFIFPPPAPMPSNNYSNEGTAAGSNTFLFLAERCSRKKKMSMETVGLLVYLDGAPSLCDQDHRRRRDLW